MRANVVIDDDVVAGWLDSVAPHATLCSDSRTVVEGSVFFAYPGDAVDGRQYIGDAVRRGAVAVMYDPNDFEWPDDCQVSHQAVPDLKQRAGKIAATHYGQPDKDMFVVAITGTNGKTSCAVWLASLLSQVKGRAASIGTLGVGICNQGSAQPPEPTGYTTPDAVQLQKKLAALRDAGVKAIAIEASSIGLDQGRLNGMHIDVALFTNLSRDHLDYHADMAQYESAKAALFDWPGLRHAVINCDDAAGRRFADAVSRKRADVKLVGYRIESASDDSSDVKLPILQASQLRSSAAGTTFNVASPFGTSVVKTRLAGHFNVANALGVLGVLLAADVSYTDAMAMLESLQAAPGRMQQIGGSDGPLVVVDYAHTPDALDKAIGALRDVSLHRHGELWCVFGCGGDRDAGKRPEMGAAAAKADRVVITSDNPRNEDPMAIITAIAQGIAPTEKEAKVQIIEDRANAILWAVRHAARADVILVAGKGHETTQEIRGRKMPFSDAEHAAIALSSRVTTKEAS